jgi:SnoaL-like polyketide cyclase
VIIDPKDGRLFLARVGQTLRQSNRKITRTSLSSTSGAAKPQKASRNAYCNADSAQSRAGKEKRNDTQCSDNNAQWDAQPLLLIGVSSRNPARKPSFMGIPATGRKIRFDVHARGRFVDGKMAERWDRADFEDIKRQLTGPTQ